jgi:long-chain acyl-CoA synthetase
MNSDFNAGSCGGPVANVKMRLRSIPEMNRDATTDPRTTEPSGELLVAGSSIMKGYFNNPEKTDEMLPDGKWLHTGDVCKINKDGSISVVDRVKNIFKLSQGEYVAPEKLENIFVQSNFVAQAWVHGDSFHNYTVLFVVVSEDILKEWGSGDINTDDKVNQVFESIKVLIKEHKLNSLERPGQIMLLREGFSIENNMLTPTMKMKRIELKKKYEAEIIALYAKPALNAKAAAVPVTLAGAPVKGETDPNQVAAQDLEKITSGNGQKVNSGDDVKN